MESQMRRSSILIVEDDWIISGQMERKLSSMGYQVIGQTDNYNEAIMLSRLYSPDIVIIDIMLAGSKTGIDLGKFLNIEFPEIRSVFLSSLSDPATLEKVKKTNPSGYLTKPFTYSSLQTTIEIALNHKSDKTSEDVIAITDGKKTYFFDLSEIMFVKSEHIYVTFFTIKGSTMVRSSLKKITTILPGEIFIHIHRSYIVNRKFVSFLSSSFIKVKDYKIPVRRNFHEWDKFQPSTREINPQLDKKNNSHIA